MLATPRSSRARRRPADKGAVLVVVLLVMMALLGLGLTGLYLTTGSIQMNANINMRNQALQVAEAGIQRAKMVLNRQGLPGWEPDISGLLAGTKSPAGQALGSLGLPDAIPSSSSECLGGTTPRAGAVLRDEPGTVRGCASTSAYYNCALLTDPNDPTEQSLGTYTVFIRQDLAECRLGGNLFTCETPRGGISTCVDGVSNGVTSNGIVVIRSVGIASDKRTIVALEVTMARNPNASAANVQLAPICPAGQAGCDDNASVQQGITVSGALTPPPPTSTTTGSSTSTGTSMGTSTGAGTGTDTGTTSTTGTTTATSTGTSSGPGSTGTASDTGTGTGTGTSTGTGTQSTSTATSTSTSTNTFPCLNYAVSAELPGSNGCIGTNWGMLIDSYSHLAGPYDAVSNHGVDGNMKESAAFNNCPENCSNASCIKGTVTYNATPTFDANSIPAPAYVSNWTNVQAGGSAPANVSVGPFSETTYYNDMRIDGGGTLTLHSGNYVVGNLTINGGGTLVIDGTVHLWVLNAPSPNGPVVVTSNNPSDFWLIYNGTGQINNNSGNAFTGVIFAPAASINLNYQVSGAVVAGRVQLNGSAAVHYDTAMRCVP